jgi:hypothetical protein
MPERKDPRVQFISREQVFRFAVNGLQPMTIHKFYFERQLVDGSKLKPVGGKLGDTLKTDADGYVEFDYYYDSGLAGGETPLAQAQAAANAVAGVKEVILTTLNVASLPDNYDTLALSYFRSHIRVQIYIPPVSEFEDVAA